MQNYIYSDLAIECSAISESAAKNKKELKETVLGDSTLTILTIDTDELSKMYQRDKGRYVTLSCKKIWMMSDGDIEDCATLIGRALSELIEGKVPKKKKDLSVLAVGLGNSEITPDAIGPLTISHLTVTRHISSLDPSLFSSIGQCKVSAFIPGVLAQTGIETLELVRGAVQNVSPDIVIAIDALVARSRERLAATVQLCDVGISPGSGIGNRRSAINEDNLGVPVIAVGVPTVVDSATLVFDALSSAGISEIPKELCKQLDNGRSFFVAPKECDVISDSVGLLLSRALDKAFSIN